MHAVIIIMLILAILLVIFTLQNTMMISISLFFWKIDNAPLVLVLLSCLVLGYIIASIYFFPRIWQLKKDYKKVVKFNKKLEKKIELDQEFGTSPKPGPEGIELNPDNEEDDDKSFFRE